MGKAPKKPISGRAPERRRCTAKSKQRGERCRNWTVAGKDKCRFHGGATPIRHGLNSKYRGSAELLRRIEAARSDPRLGDLRDLMARVQGSMDHVLERLESGDGFCVHCGTPGTESLRLVESLAVVAEKLARVRQTEETIKDGIKVKILRDARGDLVVELATALEKVAPQLGLDREAVKKLIRAAAVHVQSTAGDAS